MDARFNQVVQCLNDRETIGSSRTTTSTRVNGRDRGPWHASLHAWLIDIDGNVNSWGLLWKLLSGCCVLRVSSDRQQWFHKRMVPWTHMVPIAPDLSDLRERIHWCLNNRDAANPLRRQDNNWGNKSLKTSIKTFVQPPCATPSIG